MNDVATIEMKKYLGVPEDFKTSFATLYKVATRFEEMTSNDQGVTPFGIICWLDNYGNFTEKKDLCSRVVNQIFMGMGNDIVNLLPFIELCENNYVEEEEDE